MEKVTKNARIADLESKLMVMQTQINSLIECGHSHTKRLIALEPDNPFHGKFYEPSEPKPKQLDQSVFDGLDEKWRFAAVDRDGAVFVFVKRPDLHCTFWGNADSTQFSRKSAKGAYDKTDWQNSLIERDKVELTGSDLCRAMLERGDKYVGVFVSCENDATAEFHANYQVAIGFDASDGGFKVNHGAIRRWKYAVPVNNQGEPLTATDVGL